ncbi:MAG TPA: RDD family protein [Thermomicrobiales bacterium]|jgi:uncharacterized RDD family membrane protein YckC
MELASVTRRTVAFAFDVGLLCALGYAALIVAAPYGSRAFAESSRGLLLLLALGNGYFVIAEALWGTTLGKRLCGIRVVTVSGAPIGWWRALVRQAARLIDGQFLHLPGRLLIGLTPRRQRLGDFAAGTIVVRQRPTQ